MSSAFPYAPSSSTRPTGLAIDVGDDADYFEQTSVAIHGLPPNRKFRTATSQVFPSGFAVPREDRYQTEGNRLSSQVSIVSSD
jgi:hypothetical protein